MELKKKIQQEISFYSLAEELHKKTTMQRIGRMNRTKSVLNKNLSKGLRAVF